MIDNHLLKAFFILVLLFLILENSQCQALRLSSISRWKFDLDGPDVSREYLRVGSERIPLDPVNSSASLSIITALKVRTVRAAKSIGFEDGKEEARTLFGNETVVGTMLLRGWLPSAIFDDSSLR